MIRTFISFHQMDHYGIDKSVITFSANIVQIISALSEDEMQKKQLIASLNQAMMNLHDRFPERVIPYAYVDPNLKDSSFYTFFQSISY